MNKSCLKIILITLCCLVTACSSTNQLSIKTVQPARVDLANNIKRIGIINSSIPAERAEYKDRLGQILSSEDQELAKQGTDAAINGLFQELAKDQRFEEILLLENVPEVVKGMHLSPDQNTWATIDQLCKDHAVDAIFSLAYYDTDTKISLKKTKMEQRDLMRDYVQVKAHEITLETLIENGWRIYDPQHKEVIDEFEFNDHITTSAKGINPILALQAITDRKDSVLHKSTNTGSAYGSRLLPSTEVVYRAYYANGSENLEQADKLAQEEEYEAASRLWKLDLDHDSAKIRARACHNLAVYQELLGELYEALELATKSYEIAKNKNTQNYIEALEHRVVQQQLLAQQMAYIDILRP